ncbi:MAG: transcriptional regulator [Sphingobacteriaceae bacterium]|nr:MAG: transcriptional regulator [Sphingobacteriaceae bacterium]
MRKLAVILFTKILVLLLVAGKVHAADIRRIVTPFVENYFKGTYQASNQNWSVTKDEQGIMYFGNSAGLLSFDGNFWQLKQMPNRITVRAVAADGKGKVYVGGFGEFGYWQYNKARKQVYHSMLGLLPVKEVLKDEIWKIYTDKEKVIFQSFAAIYIYQKGKIQIVKAEQPFLFLFKADSRYFIEVLEKGLFELKDNKLIAVSNSQVFGNANVLSILPFGKDAFLIGTDKQGLFLYDPSGIRPWKNQADSFLKTYQLNNGCIIKGGFAFGTILNGIILVDQNGNITQQISKSSGLQNNTVLSVYTDQAQNLWAALDNGIDRIEINSTLGFFLDKTGSFGTVYTSIIYQNKIYLGTNQGLFYSDLAADQDQLVQKFSFKLIPGSQGQVWDLSVIDGQLFCGHNSGTYLVNNDKINKISAVNGGWMLKPYRQNVLLQGTYTGLVIYRKENSGKWLFANQVKGFSAPAKYIQFDQKNNIWIGHAYKGLYRLNLSADFLKVAKVQSYDQKSGLPDNYHIGVFNLEEQLVFATDAGFYRYDDITDRFSNYAQLNRLLGSFSSSNKIIKAADKKYWFINQGKMAMVDFAQPGKIKVDSVSLNMLNGKMLQNYENISRINASNYLISVDDGFVIYDAVNSAGLQKETLPRVLIRKIEIITKNIYTIADGGNKLEKITIPFDENNLRIAYALPYYKQATVKFQYQLAGFNDDWSSWTAQPQKEFNNLSPGDYIFRVRALINGKIQTGATVLYFTVNPPWYSTTAAYFVYLLFFVAALWFFRNLYLNNLKKHQQNIQQKLLAEQEEFLKQEAVISQQKIARLQNEQLQAELQSKGRELANSAMNIVYKNELLQSIRQELSVLRDGSGNKIPAEQLRKLQKVIADGITDDRDWNLFENSFNETNENFFKKLKADHPGLVPNDLKLCAYLKMNMSSKEIASLFNITLRGVEIRRYRLRKKLKLEHDQNLTEFLMAL